MVVPVGMAMAVAMLMFMAVFVSVFVIPFHRTSSLVLQNDSNISPNSQQLRPKGNEPPKKTPGVHVLPMQRLLPG